MLSPLLHLEAPSESPLPAPRTRQDVTPTCLPGIIPPLHPNSKSFPTRLQPPPPGFQEHPHPPPSCDTKKYLQIAWCPLGSRIGLSGEPLLLDSGRTKLASAARWPLLTLGAGPCPGGPRGPADLSHSVFQPGYPLSPPSPVTLESLVPFETLHTLGAGGAHP